MHPGNPVQPGVTEHKDRDWETRNKANSLVKRLGKKNDISISINMSITHQWSWHNNLKSLSNKEKRLYGGYFLCIFFFLLLCFVLVFTFDIECRSP